MPLYNLQKERTWQMKFHLKCVSHLILMRFHSGKSTGKKIGIPGMPIFITLTTKQLRTEDEIHRL